MIKQVLVTGGTGFIGSHLCKYLLSNNNYVICLDNNSTGSIDNIKDIKNHPNFEFIRHDVTKEIYIEVDEIYHLACPASPIAYQKNSIKTIKTNILGTMNMLGLAKRTGAKILLTSTSEVYGDPKISPQNELYWGNVNPIGIRSCYDEGKRLAETLMIEYNRIHKVNIAIARLFNTYGPNMSEEDGRVVSNFINQAIKNQPITVYGNGLQTRSFCYVSDTVEGLFKLMNSDIVTPVNIGNPNETTILDFANKIVEITSTKSKIIFKNLPSDDPLQRRPDITKAYKELNWVPNVDIDSGLKKTIEYFTP